MHPICIRTPVEQKKLIFAFESSVASQNNAFHARSRSVCVFPCAIPRYKHVFHSHLHSIVALKEPTRIPLGVHLVAFFYRDWRAF